MLNHCIDPVKIYLLTICLHFSPVQSTALVQCISAFLVNLPVQLHLIWAGTVLLIIFVNYK